MKQKDLAFKGLTYIYFTHHLLTCSEFTKTRMEAISYEWIYLRRAQEPEIKRPYLGLWYFARSLIQLGSIE